MQAAATFLIDLQRRGFTLRPEGDRIWVFPGERLTKAERNRVQRFKPDLLTLLSRQPAPRRAETVPEALQELRLDQCPSCRRQLDAKLRCWKCCDRRCGCGCMTGSAFLERCIPCERATEAGT